MQAVTRVKLEQASKVKLKVVWVIGGDPLVVEVANPTPWSGWQPERKPERVVVPPKPGIMPVEGRALTSGVLFEGAEVRLL